MTDLDQQLDSLRAVLAEAMVADFDDVLARRRRVVRRRVLAATVMVTGVAAAGVLTLGGNVGGRDSLTQLPAGTPRPSPAAGSPAPTSGPTATAAVGPVLDWALAFAPDGTAWALTGTLCTASSGPSDCHPVLERSADAGATWQAVTALPTYQGKDSAPAIIAADGPNLWVRTDSRSGVHVSHDGGRTWRAVPTPVGGTAVAGGTIWMLACTNDGACELRVGAVTGTGLRASLVQPFTGRYPVAPGPVAGIAATDTDHALVAQAGSTAAAATADRGRSWTPRRTPCRLGAGSLAGTADGSYWLLCAWEPAAGNQPKQLYRSTDQGASWQREPDPETHGYAGRITAIDATTAWRTGGRAPVYRTADGGRSWQAQLTDVFGDPVGGGSPEAFAARDGSTALASTWHGELYRTTDGGRRWHRQTVAVTSTTPTAGSPPSATQIAAVMNRTVEIGGMASDHFTAAGPPVTVSDGSGGTLTAVLGIRSANADGHGFLVFFWHGSRFVGWDSNQEAMTTSVVGAGPGAFAVTYANYAGNDAACCPSLPTVTVTYRWDGTAFRRGQAVPPGVYDLNNPSAHPITVRYG